MKCPKIAALVVAVALAAGCSTSVESGPQPLTREVNDNDFLEITDCRELEQLASAEVDRVTNADDQVVIDEATDRFNRIVAHRDSIC